MTSTNKVKTNTFYGVWLIVASLLGLLAAFSLTLEKINALTHPKTGALCDFSAVVQCSANLASNQGAILGFPNPLIGLMTWPFVLLTGVLVLSRIKLPKFYWAVFLLGVTGALSFVIWLISQSVFVIGTLCLWCMLTWFSVITVFLATLAHSGSEGVFGDKLSSFFQKSKSYIIAASILIVFAVALVAQLRLDWVATL